MTETIEHLRLQLAWEKTRRYLLEKLADHAIITDSPAEFCSCVSCSQRRDVLKVMDRSLELDPTSIGASSTEEQRS